MFADRFQSMRKFQFQAFNVILMVHALSLLSLFVFDMDGITRGVEFAAGKETIENMF